MENNLAYYASVMQEIKRNGWNVHLLADIAVGEREPADEATTKCYQKRIEADKKSSLSLTVIDPDQWEECTPEYLSNGGCCSSPRVWCEEVKNHFHPKRRAAPPPDLKAARSVIAALASAPVMSEKASAGEALLKAIRDEKAKKTMSDIHAEQAKVNTLRPADISVRLRDTYENWALGSKGPIILVEAADELDAKDAEIAKLRDVIERLGSGEAFTTSFYRNDNNEGRELVARIDFARASLEASNG